MPETGDGVSVYLPALLLASLLLGNRGTFVWTTYTGLSLKQFAAGNLTRDLVITCWSCWLLHQQSIPLLWLSRKSCVYCHLWLSALSVSNLGQQWICGSTSEWNWRLHRPSSRPLPVSVSRKLSPDVAGTVQRVCFTEWTLLSTSEGTAWRCLRYPCWLAAGNHKFYIMSIATKHTCGSGGKATVRSSEYELKIWWLYLLGKQEVQINVHRYWYSHICG